MVPGAPHPTRIVGEILVPPLKRLKALRLRFLLISWSFTRAYFIDLFCPATLIYLKTFLVALTSLILSNTGYETHLALWT